MKVPKDHKLVSKYFYALEGPIEEVIARLRKDSEDILEPRLVAEYCGYDGGYEYRIEGFRPMTEQEKAKAKKERAAERARRKKQKEDIEKAELDRLKELAKKFGKTIS